MIEQLLKDNNIGLGDVKVVAKDGLVDSYVELKEMNDNGEIKLPSMKKLFYDIEKNLYNFISTKVLRKEKPAPIQKEIPTPEPLEEEAPELSITEVAEALIRSYGFEKYNKEEVREWLKENYPDLTGEQTGEVIVEYLEAKMEGREVPEKEVSEPQAPEPPKEEPEPIEEAPEPPEEEIDMDVPELEIDIPEVPEPPIEIDLTPTEEVVPVLPLADTGLSAQGMEQAIEGLFSIQSFNKLLTLVLHHTIRNLPEKPDDVGYSEWVELHIGKQFNIDGLGFFVFSKAIVDELIADGLISDDYLSTATGKGIITLSQFCLPYSFHPFAHVYYQPQDIYNTAILPESPDQSTNLQISVDGGNGEVALMYGNGYGFYEINAPHIETTIFQNVFQENDIVSQAIHNSMGGVAEDFLVRSYCLNWTLPNTEGGEIKINDYANLKLGYVVLTNKAKNIYVDSLVLGYLSHYYPNTGLTFRAYNKKYDHLFVYSDIGNLISIIKTDRVYDVTVFPSLTADLGKKMMEDGLPEEVRNTYPALLKEGIPYDKFKSTDVIPAQAEPTKKEEAIEVEKPKEEPEPTQGEVEGVIDEIETYESLLVLTEDETDAKAIQEELEIFYDLYETLTGNPYEKPD